MSTRIGWIDYAKGLGIILVVYGHVIRGLYVANIGLSETFYHVSDMFVYGFHMPLFFFISGLFVDSWIKKNTIKDAFIEKVRVIVWPYFLWSLIQGSTNVIFSSVTNARVTWGDLGIKILVSPLGQFWFLYVLFIQYMVVLFLYKRLSVLQILLLSICVYLMHPYMVDYWILGKFFSNFVYLCLGLKVKQIGWEKIYNGLRFFGYPVILTIFIFISSGYIFAIQKFLSVFFVAVTGILVVIYSSIILSNNNLAGWIKELGALSMPIYLLHILFASGSRIIISKIFENNNIGLHVLIGVISGVVLPVVIYRLFKKIKVERYAFGR